MDATYTHGVGTAYTPCSVVGLHALRRLRRANASKEENRRFVDGVADKVTDSMLSSWQSRTSRSFSVLRQAFTTDPEVHERIRGSSGWQMTYSFCPYGLWASLRYLAKVDRYPVAADNRARLFASQIDRRVQFVHVLRVLTLTRSRVAVQRRMLVMVVSDQDGVADPNFVKIQ